MTPIYISANIAVARTRNARKSDAYIATYKIFPGLMAQAMEAISEASGEGAGSAKFHIHQYWFQEYSNNALIGAIELMEHKLIELGYYLIKLENHRYEFVWLSEGEN